MTRKGIEVDGVNPHDIIVANKLAIVWRYKEILTLAGFNIKHPAMERTAERMWEVLEIMTRGYDIDVSLERMYDDYTPEGTLPTLRVCPGIEFVSMCEHHLLPFIGVCHIAYIPNKRMVTGLSKLPQLVQKYALRPQLQEKMQEEIANELIQKCGFEDVMVVVAAKHGCEVVEGIKYTYSRDPPYPTSTIRGLFITNEPLRAEALKLMGIT